MPLSTGDKLGPYEVLALIGAGGMGEVYRAHDTKLKRDVALKVLPEAFARDLERMARFEREAEVLASLNHPNIAAIYGVVEDRALVMELVEGVEPKGPLPFDEAWQIASQMEAALEYAHEKGIVHRDLKPANIKVTADGVVKLLDFGLAKTFTTQREGPPSTAENSPTLTIGATEIGVILGTAAYMSPEQAKGKTVDKRADIWSFGVVLYELLTGDRLFKGEDVSDTLVSVLRDEPDLTKVPPKAHKLLRRCLEKDPKKRLRDIGDAASFIDDVPASTPIARSGWWWKAAASVLAVTLGITFYVLRPKPVELKPLVRYSIDLGPDAVADANLTAVISPDGNRLVFPVRGPNGTTQLATRRLDQANTTVLRGTEGGTLPFFAPDGQWIGFFANFKLKKLSLQGGAPIVLCDVPAPPGASWGEDGSIILGLIAGGGLFRISADGGVPKPLTRPEKGDLTHRWPQFLPGAKAVLFTASSTVTGYDGARIDALSLETGKTATLVRGGYFARYVPSAGSSGHLLYTREGTLYAVAFNPSDLTLHGKPTPMMEDVGDNPALGSGQFDVSRTGVLYYRSGLSSNGNYPVLWLDNAGKTTTLLAKQGTYFTPRFSPDGSRLALAMASEGGYDIVIYDWQKESLARLSITSGRTGPFPIWAPDGKHIVFQSISPEGSTFIWKNVDGGEEQSLFQSKDLAVPFSFSPDGKRLAYGERGADTGLDIWILPLDPSDPDHPKPGKPAPFLRTPANDIAPAFSPDGRWIAYSSDESGRFETYVRPISSDPSGSGAKWQVSNGGGAYAMWSHDGRQLFFNTPPPVRRIAVVDVTLKDGSFASGPARRWTEVPHNEAGGTWGFALHPDGKRFAIFPAVSAPAGSSTGSVHVTVLLNFFDELRRKVLAGK